MNLYLYKPKKAATSNAILALAKSRSLFLSREASPVQDPLPEQRQASLVGDPVPKQGERPV